jgi:hypothetical protein
VRFLRKSGSVSVQVTILTPSVGSKGYEESYENGMVISQAGNQALQDYQYDGNHCIATGDAQPWRKQLNLYLGYASFYNPLNFVRAVSNWQDPLWSYRVMYQAYGMAGLTRSVVQGWGWLKNLYRGPVSKMNGLPARKLDMITPMSTRAMEPSMSCQTV